MVEHLAVGRIVCLDLNCLAFSGFLLFSGAVLDHHHEFQHGLIGRRHGDSLIGHNERRFQGVLVIERHIVVARPSVEHHIPDGKVRRDGDYVTCIRFLLIGGSPHNRHRVSRQILIGRRHGDIMGGHGERRIYTGWIIERNVVVFARPFVEHLADGRIVCRDLNCLAFSVFVFVLVGYAVLDRHLVFRRVLPDCLHEDIFAGHAERRRRIIRRHKRHAAVARPMGEHLAGGRFVRRDLNRLVFSVFVLVGGAVRDRHRVFLNSLVLIGRRHGDSLIGHLEGRLRVICIIERHVVAFPFVEHHAVGRIVCRDGDRVACIRFRLVGSAVRDCHRMRLRHRQTDKAETIFIVVSI